MAKKSLQLQPSEPVENPHQHRKKVMDRSTVILIWSFIWAACVGCAGFLPAYFRTLEDYPEMNQAPLLAICFIGPLIALFGGLFGAFVTRICGKYLAINLFLLFVVCLFVYFTID